MEQRSWDLHLEAAAGEREDEQVRELPADLRLEARVGRVVPLRPVGDDGAMREQQIHSARVRTGVEARIEGGGAHLPPSIAAGRRGNNP